MKASHQLFMPPTTSRSRLLVAGENAPSPRWPPMAFAAAAGPRRLKPLLSAFGQQRLGWILGPKSLPRLHAGGPLNNPAYTASYPQCAGGSAAASPPASMTKAEVAFIPEAYKDRLDQNWRWGERWIPTPPGSLWPSAGRAHKEATMIERFRTSLAPGRAVDPPYRQPGLPWPSPGRARREVTMIEFWVGVDGGGTHTRARIRDRAGRLLGRPGGRLQSGAGHRARPRQRADRHRTGSHRGRRFGRNAGSSGWESDLRSPPPSSPTAITPC